MSKNDDAGLPLCTFSSEDHFHIHVKMILTCAYSEEILGSKWLLIHRS